jgi:hypothetical protein
VLSLAACVFVADDTGQVEYAWQTGDTDVSGTYNIEWTVIYPAGLVMTFPSRGFDRVKVYARAA